MCGRARLCISANAIANQTNVTIEEFSYPVYSQVENFSPGMVAPIVFHNQKLLQRGMTLMKWGVKSNQGLIVSNARIESLNEKPLFKKILSNRCVVVFDGFYEWKTIGNSSTKIPYYIHLSTPMMIACLYQIDPDSEKLSFTVVTCVSSPSISWLHTRQPVILTDETLTQWLDPHYSPQDLLNQLQDTQNLSEFKTHEVTSKINSITYQSLDCSFPIKLTTKSIKNYFNQKPTTPTTITTTSLPPDYPQTRIPLPTLDNPTHIESHHQEEEAFFQIKQTQLLKEKEEKDEKEEKEEMTKEDMKEDISTLTRSLKKREWNIEDPNRGEEMRRTTSKLKSTSSSSLSSSSSNDASSRNVIVLSDENEVQYAKMRRKDDMDSNREGDFEFPSNLQKNSITNYFPNRSTIAKKKVIEILEDDED